MTDPRKVRSDDLTSETIKLTPHEFFLCTYVQNVVDGWAGQVTRSNDGSLPVSDGIK
jgi:hypothetical protein